MRLTMVKNKEGEFVLTRVQNGWKVCIDYRKLNAASQQLEKIISLYFL